MGQMLVPLLLGLMAVAATPTVAAPTVAAPTDECTVQINGVPYKQEVIFKKYYFEFPSKFAYDRNTNTLYFNYFYEKTHMFQSMKINLDSKEYSQIDELTGICSFAVDHEHDRVFAGCLRANDEKLGGLYQYDSNVGQFVPINEEKDIRFVYFKDTLYYALGTSNLIYKVSVRNNRKIVDKGNYTVKQLVIDKDNSKIFLTPNGVYIQKSGTTAMVLYEESSTISVLANDLYGNTYACDSYYDKIFVLNKSSATMSEVTDANWCHGLAFDKHNIIYTDRETNKIVRLLKC